LLRTCGGDGDFTQKRMWFCKIWLKSVKYRSKNRKFAITRNNVLLHDVDYDLQYLLRIHVWKVDGDKMMYCTAHGDFWAWQTHTHEHTDRDFSERYAVRSAIYIAFPSVCLSVCLYVCNTLELWVNRWPFAEFIYSTYQTGIWFGCAINSAKIFATVFPRGEGVYEKPRMFSPYLALSRKRYGIWPQLQWKTNCPIFNDLEWPLKVTTSFNVK